MVFFKVKKLLNVMENRNTQTQFRVILYENYTAFKVPKKYFNFEWDFQLPKTFICIWNIMID